MPYHQDYAIYYKIIYNKKFEFNHFSFLNIFSINLKLLSIAKKQYFATEYYTYTETKL